MLSWTRTLNMDDGHSLLARVEPGMPVAEWSAACYRDLAHLSIARRRELVRIVRDALLDIDGEGIVRESLFLRFYRNAPASAQVDLLDLAWALSHPLPLLVAERLLVPARRTSRPVVAMALVENLVRGELSTGSVESVRKTRTVALGALERVGAIHPRGAGNNRALWAARAEPHPLAFGWTMHLAARSGTGRLTVQQAVGEGVLSTLTGSSVAYGERALAWCLAHGIATRSGDELRFDDARGAPPPASARMAGIRDAGWLLESGRARSLVT